MIALLMTLGSPAAGGTPTDQLKTATDRVLKLLQDPALGKPEQADARRRQIRAVADAVFDWRETAKRALARHWQPLSSRQRAEFARLFADLVGRSYIGRIEAHRGDTIVYPGDRIDGDEATVRTKVVTKASGEIPIDYRMAREDGGRWRIYDVIVEGVSLVRSYGVQFNRIISQSGYDALVTKMRTGPQDLMPAQSP